MNEVVGWLQLNLGIKVKKGIMEEEIRLEEKERRLEEKERRLEEKERRLGEARIKSEEEGGNLKKKTE